MDCQSPSVPDNVIALRDYLCTQLEEGKAHDLAVISLHGKTDIADFMIIVSSNASRHSSALAERLIEKTKHHARFDAPLRVEGIQEGNWVLLDFGDIIVHIFLPEIRALYNLEQMWSASSSPNHHSPHLLPS